MADAGLTAGGLRARLAAALDARMGLFDPRHEAAFRLFAGFYEGCPDLAVDVYARTLVLHNYADPPGRGEEAVQAALAFYREQLPWLRCAVTKPRHAADPGVRRGRVLFGGPPDREAREAGVRYSLDVLAHRDAGLYLDTRAARAWAREHLRGKTVLNAFAYTGSLGAAALSGGAAQVVQLDTNRDVLNQAKTTYTLNGFPIHKPDFAAGDFWAVTSRMRRAGQAFDCVFLDPPFFAASGRGTVDLERGFGRLINKARPLVAGGGWLVAINNALFVSGADCLREIEALCADGYLSIEALLPVPDDVTGYPGTRTGAPPADPAPYNHATKMTVLRVHVNVARAPSPRDMAG